MVSRNPTKADEGLDDGRHARLEAELHRALDEEKDEDVKRVLQTTVATDVRNGDPQKKEVSRQLLVRYIEQERQRYDDCLQLPCTIAFFVVFVCTVLMHEDLANSAQVERNFRGMIMGTTFEGLGPPVSLLKTSGHKDMGDIDTVADIWTYLQEAIVPLFIPADPSTLRRQTDVYRVLRYSHLIGGVQLQQIRRTRRECTAAYPNLGPKVPDSDFNPVLADVYCYPYDSYDAECFGPGSGEEGFCPDSKILGTTRRLSLDAEGEDEPPGLAAAVPRLLQGLQRHSAKVQGRSWDAISGGSFEGGLFTVLLHPHEGLSVAMQKLKTLQDQSWIDEGTAWFGVKMFLLHPDLSVYLHVIASVWLTPSGELVPGLRLTSFPAEPYQYSSRIALDVVWLILWLYQLLHCFTNLLRAVFVGKTKAHFRNFWTWVDWFTVFGGVVVLACWPVFLMMLGTLQERALALAQERPVVESNFQFDDAAHRERYLSRTTLLHTEAAGFAGFVTLYRVFACNYTILLIVRFFKAFQAQPRLAIVTNTIASSMSDIGHFVVVLSLVIVSFAAAGMFLFGHRLLEFSSAPFAISTCFLIMLGDFDYEKLRDEHPLMAAMWFWSYFLFVSLILLNMALAIVMDVYAEVAANAANSESMWDQFMRFVKVVWHRRDWMGYAKVLHKIRGLAPEVEVLTIESLSEAVPDMPPEQAVELIEAGENLEAEEAEKGLSMADALCMVSWTKDAVKEIGSQMEILVELMFARRESERSAAATVAAAAAAAPADVSKRRASVPAFISFDPATQEKLSKLEARFQRLEEIAGEAVHAAVASSRQMRGQLANLESAICGKGLHSSPGRSPPGSPRPEHAGLGSRRTSRGSSHFDF